MQWILVNLVKKNEVSFDAQYMFQISSNKFL